MTIYRIGTFNLEYGRKNIDVAVEIRHALFTNNLDALVVQEAKDYFFQLSHILGYHYYCGIDPYKRQVGILVRTGHTVTNFNPRIAGDGWTTESHDFHGPVSMPELVINKRFGLKGVHLPTPSMWKNGNLIAPKERIDDLKACMIQGKSWLTWSSDYGSKHIPKFICGDWNEKPSTTGQYSPRWLANQTHSNIHTTIQSEPHGNIDYFIGKGPYRFIKCYQDNKLKEGSDHELRILVVGI